MPTRLLPLVLTLSLALVLAACSSTDTPSTEGPAVNEPNGSADSPGMELRLADGLHDLEDGTVQAVGTLERIDLEGGFWAVTTGTAEAGDEGTVVAVIANGEELNDTLAPLEGSLVSILGERFEGASIRMSGPEIIAESVEGVSDTPGIAE